MVTGPTQQWVHMVVDATTAQAPYCTTDVTWVTQAILGLPHFLWKAFLWENALLAPKLHNLY